jgi:serine/threonine-protein kinase
LALLATAPGRAAGRERIIGCLWPDSSSDRARHRLSVALHVLRRGLDADALVTSGDTVALNAALVHTDAGDFLDAIGAGRLEEAVELYAGRFLEGFYLKGALDFEQWAEGERERLAGLHRWALRHLADTAAAAGDIGAECGWRRRLVTVSPYEASEVLALLKALAAHGDLEDALAHARSHVARVETELGFAARPEVGASIAELERALAARRESQMAPLQPIDFDDPPTSQPHPTSTEGVAAPASAASFDAGGWRSPVAHLRSRRFATPAALILVATTALWATETLGGGDSPSEPSVAVLAFQPGSSGGGAAALARPLAQELRATLDFIPNLRVLDRTAPIAGASDPRRIGRQLGVTSLVTGTLETEGAAAEARVQLIDTRTGEVRWEERYARRDTAALVELLSLSIADDLRLELAHYEPHDDTDNERANDSFLEGVYAHRRVTEESLWIALQHYRRAWELDPGFALAHAIAGNAYMHLTNFTLASHVGYERGREHVLQALALDSLLPEAHAQLGRLQLWWDRDFAAAERTLRRAIMLQPTYPDARTYYSYYLLNYRQDYEGALRNSRLALELDPLNTARSRDVEIMLYQSRRYEDVIEQAEHTWSLNPDVAASFATSQLAGAYREMGMYDEAITEYMALQERTRGLPPVGLAITYARMGRVEDARAILRAREARAEATGLGGDGIAMIYAALGDDDAAFQWLDFAFERSPGALVALKTSPPFDPIREDPRFHALLVRLRLEES